MVGREKSCVEKKSRYFDYTNYITIQLNKIEHNIRNIIIPCL